MIRGDKMTKWINWVTFFRNMISSLIFGLLIPFIIITVYDPNGDFFDFNAVMINGAILVAVYTSYGLFKKETFIRFLIGCGWIVTLVYFYSVGSNLYTAYLPNCGFGLFCVDGDIENTDISFQFNYAWLVIMVLCLKGINLLRHLVKPLEERRFDYLTISKKFEK